MAPNVLPIVSVNQLLRERVREFPDLEILGIPDKSLKYRKYTYKELDAAASLLAHHLVDSGLLPARAKGDTTTKLTVGLLGVSNLDYVVTEFALFRMGYCVLFISPNNAPAAIAHLLTSTQSSALIVQPSYLPSAHAALAHLAAADPSARAVRVIPQPPSDVYAPEAGAAHPDKTAWAPALAPHEERQMPVTVIHSSGSTGYPKAITATNIASVSNHSQSFGMRSLSTLPLYHAHGHANLHRALYSTKLLYLFPTGSIPLTSPNVLALLAQARDADALYGVPFALKLMAESAPGLAALRALKLVTFGGSACPDELGDALVARGVRLVGHYGMSEMGQLMTSQREFDTDTAWNWVRARGPYAKGNVADFLRFVPVGADTYELHVLDGWHAKVMSNQPDNAYATRDLFIKHPSLPDAYKFIGRIDDTLVMLNGEKTNPVPMELALRASPFLADAVVFGAGRAQVGALLLPSAEAGRALMHAAAAAAGSNSANEKEREEEAKERLLDAIAPDLARANADAPTHSRLAREALVVLPPGTDIPRADKGSIIRPRVYLQFASVIEEMYARLEGSAPGAAGGGGGKRKVGSVDEAKGVVREVMERTIGREKDVGGEKLGDDADLFEFGLDSLQSARVRNALQRELDLGGQTLSINAVFEHPSITKLSKLIVALAEGKSAEQIDAQQTMLALVERYRHFHVPPAPAQARTSGHVNGDTAAADSTTYSPHVVLLTGATGSLGAYLLHTLLADPRVQTVYCLCRATSDGDAKERVVASLAARRLLGAGGAGGLDAEVASGRVVPLAADFAAERLGLGESVYAEVARRTSVILHNAWAVNFNLGISSFENNIRGAANLMQLALSAPRPAGRLAHFYFASSVSAVAAWPGPGAVPEAITDDPAVAQGMGYAQSKWVTEKLCQIASEETPLKARVLRIGQMVGDTTNGVWNETEAISLIIKCADTIGILPDLDESVSWLPVDCAAKTILELVNANANANSNTPSSPPPSSPLSDTTDDDADASLVYHILHPSLVPWSSILTSLHRAGLAFKVLPRQDWLAALREDGPADEAANPSRKLLVFYENKYGQAELAARARLTTDKTCARSRSLREAPLPGDALVAKWVRAWKESGFLR